LPYIKVRDNIIYEISYAFINLTGYLKEDLINNDIELVFKNLFKASMEYSSISSDIEKSMYLFTRSSQARLVNVIKLPGIMPDEAIIIFNEVPNSRIEDKLAGIEHISNGTDIGIAILAVPDMILLEANGNFLSLLKSPYDNRKNSVGVSLSKIAAEWVNEDGSFIWKEVFTSGIIIKIPEFVVKRETDDEMYVDISFVPIKENDTIKYVLSVAYDVTDRVLNRQLADEYSMAIENQKNEYEKMLKTKDEFFNFISHEFKVPLTVICAAVQTIENMYKNSVPPKVRKLIHQIKQNSLRQLRLVNNLLDISKAENGYMKIHKKNIDIVWFTKSIIDSVMLYAVDRGVEIKFISDFERKIIAIDEEKYERVLLNLLSNAIKFTPCGRSIEVKISPDHDRICVMVKDEGEGIPEDKIELVFNRFVQADNTLSRERVGTGLGLTLVRLLVNAMGGEVFVKSKVDVGSIFTIVFPMDEVAADESCNREINYGIPDNNLVYAAAIEFSDIYLQYPDDKAQDNDSTVYHSQIKK